MKMNKICAKCKKEKDLLLFSKNSSSKDGYQHWCKPCVSINSTSYYSKKNLDASFRKAQTIKSAAIKKKYPEVYKNSELKRTYGIDFNTYQAMFSGQNGHCAICQDQMTSPCVDHCHVTGNVRKLLCRKCNTLLGQARENISILENAISYLKEFQNETNS